MKSIFKMTILSAALLVSLSAKAAQESYGMMLPMTVAHTCTGEKPDFALYVYGQGRITVVPEGDGSPVTVFTIKKVTGSRYIGQGIDLQLAPPDQTEITSVVTIPSMNIYNQHIICK